jgi:hypothetical protein
MAFKFFLINTQNYYTRSVAQGWSCRYSPAALSMSLIFAALEQVFDIHLRPA